MMFHFPWVVPLISDRSVWHNGKQPLFPVNSNENCTGMKNTGLKMPEIDQIYVLVGFLYYIRESKL